MDSASDDLISKRFIVSGLNSNGTLSAVNKKKKKKHGRTFEYFADLIDNKLGLLPCPIGEAFHTRAEGTLSIQLRGGDNGTVVLQVAHKVRSSRVSIGATGNRTLECVVGSTPIEPGGDSIYEHVGRYRVKF